MVQQWEAAKNMRSLDKGAAEPISKDLFPQRSSLSLSPLSNQTPLRLLQV